MKFAKYLLLGALAGTLLPACMLSKNRKIPQKPITPTGLPTIGFIKPSDSVIKGAPKRLSDLITSKFRTDSGFVNLHQLEDKFYLEIPDSILGRDIMIVTRVAQAAAGNRISRGEDGFSGSNVGERVIKLLKGPKNKLFIHNVSYSERAADTSANGMYTVLQRSSLEPIAAAFDIKAFNSSKSSSLIDLSDFVLSDQSVLGFNASTKRRYGLGMSQKDKSYVSSFDAFPNNLELQTMNTFIKGDGTITYQLNNSIVLLPKHPMKPRAADRRMGYFTNSYTDFDEPQGTKNRSVINRFRLEPKPEDVSRYLSGELVEPKNPIVYYIDPATPKQWVKYLIAGVNDWQKAFEKAGFKNAIYALEAPKNDKNWSLYDARHNAIMYLPSTLANAMGPQINDPRSGEILETHISWYHNVMTLVHDWYMVMASPNDPRARKMVFDDELMGELIRFVSSHEVGHTLGLRHNFLASSTVPVDSLRSKTYLTKNGFSPSIMDYARFNYVAQPQDGIPPALLMPRIGNYDEWAIEYGYRWFPENAKENETASLNKWISGKLGSDKQLSYLEMYLQGPSDPRAQIEDLGDDAVKAGRYGMNNLKIVMRNLPEWTANEYEDNEDLSRMYKKTIQQYYMYIRHVAYNISLFTANMTTQNDEGSLFGYVPKGKKLASLGFLDDYLFNIPAWLDNQTVTRKTGEVYSQAVSKIQDVVLSDLLSTNTFQNLAVSNQMAPVSQRFTFDELLSALETNIWKELKTGKPISSDRRLLQRMYAEKLIELQQVDAKDKANRQDAIFITKAHLNNLVQKINQAVPATNDRLSRLHLQELAARVKWSLKPESYTPTPTRTMPIMPSLPAASIGCGAFE